MANGIGAALEIPESVFNKIQQAQDAIEKLEKTATEKSSKMTEAFKQIGDIGIDNFIKKLKSAQEVLNSLSLDKLNISGTGMKDASTQAEQMANSVVRAADAVNRFSDGKMNIAELTAEIKKMKEELTSDGGIKPISEQQSRVDTLRQYEEELKMQKKSSDEKIKLMEKETAAKERELKKQQQAAAKFDSQMRRLNYQSYVTSVEGSLRTASKATSYAQREQAIKNLEAAIKKLNVTDADYQSNLTKLSNKHRELVEQQKQVEMQYRSINKEQSNLMNTSEQLSRKLALIFSVSAISNYVDKLIKVRGEFELQNTALASILNNKEQANRLFNQITQLAVKSPFTIKELTTYTKSLAAYQFQYEELYDTTKRLADVSAGLGVDMQRLILAIGQVKAAGYLRGTETRQFTEAGFNILGELAKYYSELEGKIVSVGEVQERQFKRMIAFEDVAEVFRRVTEEGGLFYKMQEKQSETLAGLMSNLKDRIELTLNSIGKENDSIIKGGINLIGSLLDNYEAVIKLIKAAGAAFVLYKIRLLTVNKALIEFALNNNVATAAMTKQLTIMQLLKVGLLKISTSLKSAGAALKNFVMANPLVTALVLVGTAITSVVSHYQQLDEELKQVEDTANSHAAALRKLTEGYRDVEKAASNASKKMSEDDIYKGKFAELQKLQEALKDRGYSLPIDIEFVTKENIDEIYKQGTDILKFANEWAEQFGKTITERFNDWEIGGLVGDNLKTDLKDLSDAYSNLQPSFFSDLEKVLWEVDEIQGSLNQKAREYYDEIKKGKKENETDVEFALRKLDLLMKINTETSKFTQGGYLEPTLESADTLFNRFYESLNIIKAQKEAEKELSKVVDDLAEKYGGLEQLQAELAKNPVAVKMEIDKEFEKLQMEETAQRWAAFFLMQKFKINVDVTPQIKPDKNIYSDFRATIQAIDTKGLFKEQLKNIQSIEDLVPIVQKVYKEQADGLERLNGLNAQNLNLEEQIKATKNKMLSDDEQTRVNAEYELGILEKQKSVIENTLKTERERLEENKKISQNVANAFNISLTSDNDKGAKSANNTFKQRIDFFKKLNTEYEKLLDYYSEEEAAQKILQSRAEEAKALGVFDLFKDAKFDDEGTLRSFERIKDGIKSLSSDMKIAIGESIGDIKTTMEIEVRKKDIKDMQSYFDTLFSGYELSLELDKAGLDKNLMSELLGIDTFSLGDIKTKLFDLKDEFIGKEGIQAYEDLLKKISDEEQKDLQNRIKEYSKYLAKTMTEVEQIKRDAEKQIINIPVNFTPEMKKEVIKKIKKEAQQKIASAQFEEFKGSDLYANVFEDLERVGNLALETLLSKLEEIKQESGRSLPVNDFKELITALKKIRDEVESRNPFQGLVNGIKEWKQATDEVNIAEDNLEKVRNGQKVFIGLQKDEEGKLVNVYLDEEEAIKRLITAQNMQANARTKVINSIKNIQEGYQKVSEVISSVTNLFGEVADAMGLATDDNARAAIEGIAKGFTLVASALGVVVTVMAAADILGKSLMATLTPLLAIGAAIGGIFAIVNIHDNKRQQEIEAEEKKIKRLQDAYDKLGDAIENALDIDQLSKANDAAIKNLEAQINSYREMIALEEDKKKTDEDKIDEYYDAIAELEKEKADFQKSLVESYGGIGENNFADAAQQFVDAWYDAFLETGNGLSALDDEFKDFFDNMIKKQLMLRGANKFLEPFFKEFDKMFGESSAGGENVTKEEIDALQSQWETTSEGLNEFLTNLAEGLGIVGGSASAELDGLSRGIQSVTEETAEVIAGLLNSMRYFVADSNTQLKSIYMAIKSPSSTNPIVSELKAQTEQLRLMNNLWRSLVKSSGSGDAIKVILM